MSWMHRLYDVYENNQHQIGKFESYKEGQRFTLLPVSHITQNAHIEITLDHSGNLYKAEVIPKEHSRTIVPATINSANRAGSKVAAHYLHDKLFYVAGDYIKYGGSEKRSENYESYVQQMKKWATSNFTHSKVKLVYQYVKQGKLIEDLVREKVLYTDENDQLIEKWTSKEEKKYNIEKPEIYKVVTGNSSEALVRFKILSDHPDDPPLWEDIELYDVFINYLNNEMKEEEVGLCYVTGQEVSLTDSHGSRLRNAGDMSKLISSNHNKNKNEFIYMGRFEHPNQAVQIGYDVSQKAHNALRWLIQRQGIRSDTRNFVTFGLKKPDTIQPFDGTKDLMDKFPGFEGLEMNLDIDKDYANRMVSEQVQKAFNGLKYNLNLEGVDQVLVLAVDAATTGRLAIVYYQEFDNEIFFDNLAYWHKTCLWHQSYYDKTAKKTISFEGTPSTYHIVEAVYGERADVRIKKELYTRLLPCIVDRARLPKDIVVTIYNRLKNPMSFSGDLSSSTNEWQRTLGIACALIRKRYEKEEIQLTLDLENQSRDYLFGRLLGVAEVLERNELRKRDEKRPTNAMRYFNAFSQHPARVWQIIRKQLHPYQVRQGENISYYNKLIREIESNMDVSYMNNDALGPKFLLGYSSQIEALYTKKEEKEASVNDSN